MAAPGARPRLNRCHLQVVGAKRVLLFSPNDSEYLYPHNESLLNNTAQVDPYKPDLSQFPEYEKAVVHYCELRPGTATATAHI